MHSPKTLAARFLTAGMALAIASCSSEASDVQASNLGDTDGLSEVVVDYSSWPLPAALGSAAICDPNHNSLRSPMYLPKLSEAESVGYGYLDEQLKQFEGRDDRSFTDCSAFSQKLQAYNQALAVWTSSDVASEAYGQWSKCMGSAGFPRIKNPVARQSFLAGKLYSMPEGSTEALSSVVDRADRLRSEEREMATADIVCQEKAIRPVEDELTAQQQTAIDSLPGDLQQELRG